MIASVMMKFVRESLPRGSRAVLTLLAGFVSAVGLHGAVYRDVPPCWASLANGEPDGGDARDKGANITLVQ